MSSDESDCPLCLEPMDSDDASFYPCPCLYQVCRFCWAKILNEENGLCPACRQPYDSEAPAVFVPQNNVTEHKRKPSKRKKETQTKAHISKDTLKMLPELRVIQTNLVFVVGLPQWISKDKEILKNVEYFGQFGKVFKVEVNPNPNFTNPQGQPSISAYITYYRPDDAMRAVLTLDQSILHGRQLRVSLGTTKYCSQFLKGQKCSKHECMYLHDLGDPKASFTKEQMQAGKHTEYMNELLQSFVAQMAGQQQQQQQQQSEGGQAGDQRHSLPPDQISPSTAAASATATDKSSATSSHSQPSSSREYAPHSEAPRNCLRRRGAGCSGPASNRNSRHEVSARTGFAGSGGTRHLAGSFSLEGEPPFSKSAVAATSLSTLKAFHPNKVDCRPRPGSDGSLSLFPPPESKDADQNATSTPAQPAPPFMHANDLSSSPADFSGGNYSNYDHHSEDPGADVAFGAPDHSPSSSATATVDASQCLRPRRVMDNSDSAQPPGSTGLNDQPPVGAIAADIDFDPIRESQQGLAELLAAEMNYPDLRSGYKKLLPSGGGGGGSSSGAGHLFAGFNADNSGRKTGGPDTQISLSTQTPLIFSPPPGFEESSNRTPPEDAVLLPFVAQQIAAQLDCPSTASSLLPPLLSTSEFGAIYTQLLESVCCNRTAVTTASDTATGISARDGPPFADPAVINATASASPSPSPSFNPLAASTDPMVAACLLAYQNLLAVAKSNQNARLVPSWDNSKTATDPSAAGAADHLLTELSQRLLECARLSFRDGGAEDPAPFDQQQQLSFSNFSGNLHIPGLTNGCYNMDLGLDGQPFCLPGFNPDAFSKGRSVGSTTTNLNNVWSSQDVTTSAPLAQPPPPPPSRQQQPQAPNSASRQHDHHQGDEQCTDQGQPAASCSSTQPPSAGTGTSSSPSSSSSAFRNFPCEPFNQPISEYSSLSQPYACLPSSDLP